MLICLSESLALLYIQVTSQEFFRLPSSVFLIAHLQRFRNFSAFRCSPSPMTFTISQKISARNSSADIRVLMWIEKLRTSQKFCLFHNFFFHTHMINVVWRILFCVILFLYIQHVLDVKEDISLQRSISSQ